MKYLLLLALLVSGCSPVATFGPQGYYMSCQAGNIDIEFPEGVHAPLLDEKGQPVKC